MYVYEHFRIHDLILDRRHFIIIWYIFVHLVIALNILSLPWGIFVCLFIFTFLVRCDIYVYADSLFVSTKKIQYFPWQILDGILHSNSYVPNKFQEFNFGFGAIEKLFDLNNFSHVYVHTYVCITNIAVRKGRYLESTCEYIPT